MKTPMVYVNGRLYPEDQPHLSALDRGFTLGDGLFETMRAAGGRVFRWEDHLARLRRGAEVLAISLPGEIALCDAVAAALEHRTGEPSLVRLTVTRGVDVGRGVAVRPGLTPTVVARAVPLVPPTTRGATAVSVARRSMLRRPGPSAKTKRVRSSSTRRSPGAIQSASMSSSPRSPLRAATMARWRMTPIFARSSAGSASDVFQ